MGEVAREASDLNPLVANWRCAFLKEIISNQGGRGWTKRPVTISLSSRSEFGEKTKPRVRCRNQRMSTPGLPPTQAGRIPRWKLYRDNNCLRSVRCINNLVNERNQAGRTANDLHRFITDTRRLNVGVLMSSSSVALCRVPGTI